MIASNHGGFVCFDTWDGDMASKQALNLDGSQAVFTLNDHDRYAFGTNDFTFEGWVNFDSIGADYLEAIHFFSKGWDESRFVFS